MSWTIRLSWLAYAALALALASVPAGAGEKASGGKVIMPFDGVSLKGWKFRGDEKKSKWVVGRARINPEKPNEFLVTVIPPQADGGPGVREMVNAQGHSVDIYTEQKFGDCTIELEVMVPKGSNSGVYVMGEYEVQVLDSYGKKEVNKGDMGAIYGISPPKVNASKKPGEWQKLVIEFQAPRFEDGKKVKNARFLKVTLNDQVIQENVEAKGPTLSSLTGKEAPTGPILLQGDHGPVAYRNIRVMAK
jgi:hypothetical protein